MFSSETRTPIRYWILVGCLFSIIIAGCVGKQATRGVNNLPRQSGPYVPVDLQNQDYIIRKGDEVHIEVWGYSEFNSRTTVREGGNIAIPLIGELRVEGLTIEQAKLQLMRKLSEYIQGEIRLSLTVGSSVPQRINVLGAVGRQENYPTQVEMSLLDVLSAAGGPTPDSDLRHIKIFPAGNHDHPIEIDLTWYMENGNVRSLPMVRPGDTIFVPRKENIIREFADFTRDVIFLFSFFRIIN